VLCFLLILPDGEPYDPAAFVTAIPNWSVGEAITLGLGEQLRILGIEVGLHDELTGRGISGVFTVAPVDDWTPSQLPHPRDRLRLRAS
jgi:hypothetical protein